MHVVEKLEIVKSKEQKLKSLGQKYVVKLFIFCTTDLTLRDVLRESEIIFLASLPKMGEKWGGENFKN